ncbi:MAG: 2Fe-2S iron-sulfur cluster binding domain-containing protein [Candidatus Eisenbacteria bacterium]|nr:2Fe-2S iron-sulfur cluster binding domain-containing protein [Candidatus Latescibacterota bacterium]MBD3302193.1 2Fe-2S iron-sulfur cluster binding domain-containing protein [Candidatus Eisenbacteria bacterium]
MSTFNLRINGQARTLDAPGDMPLLWALRDRFGLTGTKYGCGVGQCGSCTVLLDGDPIRSCVTILSDVGERSIETIERFGEDGEHPLQRAWIEERVSQCGYCQPGQIMNAAALLAANAHPSDDEINRAMSGNLCRCGTYLRIRRAIRRASEDGGVRR